MTFHVSRRDRCVLVGRFGVGHTRRLSLIRRGGTKDFRWLVLGPVIFAELLDENFWNTDN